MCTFRFAGSQNATFSPSQKSVTKVIVGGTSESATLHLSSLTRYFYLLMESFNSDKKALPPLGVKRPPPPGLRLCIPSISQYFVVVG